MELSLSVWVLVSVCQQDHMKNSQAIHETLQDYTVLLRQESVNYVVNPSQNAHMAAHLDFCYNVLHTKQGPDLKKFQDELRKNLRYSCTQENLRMSLQFTKNLTKNLRKLRMNLHKSQDKLKKTLSRTSENVKLTNYVNNSLNTNSDVVLFTLSHRDKVSNDPKI